MLHAENVIQNRSHISLQSITYILWGVALLFVTSQLSIPLQPVPITLQTVGVMLIGLTFERKHAITSVLTYLGLGAMGVPVFANYNAGLQCLLGLTGGYLWGFLAAVVVMTTLKRHLSNNIFHVTLNCMLGTAVIFMFGVGWLTCSIGLKPALNAGLYPFIIPGAIKAILLALAIKYIKLGKDRVVV